MKNIISFCIISNLLLAGLNISGQERKEENIIETAIAEINADSVESYIQSLQDFQTRFMMADNRRDIAMWIKNKFQSFGMQDVVLDSFECITHINENNLHYDTTTWQYNVIASINGSLNADEISIVCAHYDSKVEEGDPEIFAPGADDNASGVAAVLESARALKAANYQPESTLRFIAFAAEELMSYGRSGAEYYVLNAFYSRENIKMVINNDMIANDSGDNQLYMSNLIGSEEITLIVNYIGTIYTDLNIILAEPGTSTCCDLEPFHYRGYAGVYLMEYEFSMNWHTENDLIQYCNIPFCTEVVKILCGSLLYRDIFVGVKQENAMPIKIYPNPASNIINLAFPLKTAALLTIRNLKGQKLISGKISNTNSSMDVSALPAGVYLLDIKNEEIYHHSKLIIQ